MGHRKLNVNVGILGHVDSGKTSLVAALSTTLSTAALDKHPQSKARGITLDLGFSSFVVPMPNEYRNSYYPTYDDVQFTLVDCPGHASLVKTVVGGAQIIDMMILVVDVTKGIQTQTAECIVIGEITTDKLVVVLNKVDLLPEAKREKYLKKAKKVVKATFEATKFADVTIIPLSTKLDSFQQSQPAESPTTAENPECSTTRYLGVSELIQALVSMIPGIQKKHEGEFLMYIDHCFSVKGQGTVVTGTISSGSLLAGNTIEFPQIGYSRKVKSIQAFKKPVEKAVAGDRVGVCVSNLSADLIERGLACHPGTVKRFKDAIASVKKVRFFAGQVQTNSKFHVMIGHSTVMASLIFFGVPRVSTKEWKVVEEGFEFENEYLHQDYLYGAEGRPASDEGVMSPDPGAASSITRNFYGPQWVYIKFEEPVLSRDGSLILGAKLDADLNTSSCRIAFHGNILHSWPISEANTISKLQIFKIKRREGILERIEADGKAAICRDLFGKNSDMSAFIGFYIDGPNGQRGKILSPFAHDGRCRVLFDISLEHKFQGSPVSLTYKRYLYDKSRKHKIRQYFIDSKIN